MRDFTEVQDAWFDARVAHGPDHPMTRALSDEYRAHPEYSNPKPIMPMVGFDPYHNVPSDLDAAIE
jgi:hypothetical protein